MVHEQKFKDLLSRKCQVSVERIVLDLESEDPGSIPTRGNIKFYNPNLHNSARSDRIGFKTKNSYVLCNEREHVVLPLFREDTMKITPYSVEVSLNSSDSIKLIELI